MVEISLDYRLLDYDFIRYRFYFYLVCNIYHFRNYFKYISRYFIILNNKNRKNTQ